MTVLKDDHGTHRMKPLQVGNIDTGHMLRRFREFQEALETFEEACVPVLLFAVQVEAFLSVACGKVEELASLAPPGRNNANAFGFSFSEPFFQRIRILQCYGNNDFIGDEASLAVVLLDE